MMNRISVFRGIMCLYMIILGFFGFLLIYLNLGIVGGKDSDLFYIIIKWLI